MTKFTSVLVLLSMLFTACGQSSKQTNKGKASGASADAADTGINAAQHCLNEAQTLCFLEVQKDGKSNFFAPSDKYEELLVAPALASANLPFQNVDPKTYQKIADESLAAKIVYTKDKKIEVTPDPRDDSANKRFGFGKKKGGLFKKVGSGFNILSTLLFIGSFFGATNSRGGVDVSVNFGTQVFEETVAKD